MNKELTPLEALQEICGYYYQSPQYKLIETALKDYEKKTKLAKEYADVNNVAKRLKALEIIKSVVRKDSILNHLNDWLKIGAITKEQYDLLKGELL